MSRVVVGSIPKNISYICEMEKEVAIGSSYDISIFSPDSLKNVTEKILPTHPVDSSNKIAISKAIELVTKPIYDYVTKTTTNRTHTIVELENKPIKNVRLFSKDSYFPGIFKAAIGSYYIDLHEDVLVDTILKVGIEKGGILKGEFIWARIQNTIKLVRIGSQLHRSIVEFESKNDIKKIRKNDLEIGAVYQDQRKNKVVFAGYVNTTFLKSKQTSNKKLNNTDPFDFDKRKLKKAMLFYPINSYEGMDESILKMKSTGIHSFRIKNAHNYIEKIDKIQLDKDIIEFIKLKITEEVKNKMLEYTGAIPPKYAQPSAQTLAWQIERYSEFLNLYPYNGKEPDVFDVRKFLIFS